MACFDVISEGQPVDRADVIITLRNIGITEHLGVGGGVGVGVQSTWILRLHELEV